MDRKNGTSSFERQVQIVIFTLIINLGFFKVGEIHDFVSTVANMISSPTLLSIMLIGGSVIIYFIYIIAIGTGLYLSFTEKKVDKAVIVALGSFFAFYLLILIYELNSKNINMSNG